VGCGSGEMDVVKQDKAKFWLKKIGKVNRHDPKNGIEWRVILNHDLEIRKTETGVEVGLKKSFPRKSLAEVCCFGEITLDLDCLDEYIQSRRRMIKNNAYKRSGNKIIIREIRLR